MKNTCVLLAILMISSCSSAPKKTDPEAAPAPAPTHKVPEKTPVKKYPDQAEFTANCRFEGQSFSIRFQSKSGKMENNDMTVTLVTDDREIPLNVSPGWYHPVDATSALSNYCEGVPAFQVDGLPQLLLVFNLDQRVDQKPGHTETTVVLIDLKSKRVVNKLERVGKLKLSETSAYHVIPAENGFQLRLVRDPVKGNEDWKWIIIRKGSITSKWMRSNKKSARY
jgi:hypothetical protein